MNKKTTDSRSSQTRDKTKAASKTRAKPAEKSKKNIAVPKPLKKIVDAVVQPLKTVARKMKSTDDHDVPFAESRSATELTTSMKFFYSNDRFIDTFDDREVYDKICSKWPAMKEDETDLHLKRVAILEMLADEKFMKLLDDQYQLNPLDVVSFLFRVCPSLFKGIFVKKVQNVVLSTQYAKRMKKHEYKIAKTPKAAFRSRRRR